MGGKNRVTLKGRRIRIALLLVTFLLIVAGGLFLETGDPSLPVECLIVALLAGGVVFSSFIIVRWPYKYPTKKKNKPPHKKNKQKKAQTKNETKNQTRNKK